MIITSQTVNDLKKPSQNKQCGNRECKEVLPLACSSVSRLIKSYGSCGKSKKSSSSKEILISCSNLHSDKIPLMLRATFLETLVRSVRPPLCNGSCHRYGNLTAKTGISVCDAANTNNLQGARETSKFILTKDSEQQTPSNNKNRKNCGSSSANTDEV